MADPRTDKIAREAARLIETGRLADIDEAIRAAASSLKLRTAPLPGAGRVRRHAQAMAMQALGEEAYNDQRIAVWRIAEQVMAVFEHVLPDSRTLLVGRAARGQVDAGVTVHIRLYSRASVSDIARYLVEYGYEEPTFETAETTGGRLSQICLCEEGVELVLTRCPPSMALSADEDLFTGKPTETLDLSDLRRMLDSLEGE